MPDLLIIQNVACEGPGVIETLSQRHGLSYTLRRAWEEDVLRNSSQFAALIILGGPMNVYEEDRYPFLKAEGRLIRQFLEDGKPILGICLGAQLLARALGAKVFAGPQKEIGWYPVWLTPEAHLDAVFQILGKRFMAFHWHGDTFELPYGAIHLARSSMYTHQAFRLGEKAYGVSFIWRLPQR